MLNFTVGPVMSEEGIRAIASEQIPYFRTPEFSAVMLENEKLICEFMGAPALSRAVFLTGSGTSAMEAAISGALDRSDRVLVVSGGSFGERFCEILAFYGIEHTPIFCDAGKTLKAEQLAPFEGKGYTAFVVNLGETSTGILYDLPLISEFCKRNGLFLIVDAISSFLCDELDMKKYGVNVALTGSQKALALAPGISILCLDSEALARINRISPKSYYLDLRKHLSNMERGQTPFTPAVSVLLQLNCRLKGIAARGGAAEERKRTAALARYFRERIGDLPLTPFAETPSNAVTSLRLNDESKSAYTVFEVLKDEYGMFICPSGGSLKNKIFRVGHIGDLHFDDYDRLIAALHDLVRRKLL